MFPFSGMDEGIMTMKRGELGRLYIEPHKGYGSKGFPTFGYPFGFINQFKHTILCVRCLKVTMLLN